MKNAKGRVKVEIQRVFPHNVIVPLNKEECSAFIRVLETSNVVGRSSRYSFRYLRESLKALLPGFNQEPADFQLNWSVDKFALSYMFGTFDTQVLEPNVRQVVERIDDAFESR